MDKTEKTDARNSWRSRLLQKCVHLSDTMCVQWLDKSFFEAVNEQQGKRVLNLGSGKGLFDKHVKAPMTNMDIARADGVHAVADAHQMPWANGSFDCVFSNAVLEHTGRPWIVAGEIHRVLAPGGVVCVNVPFLGSRHNVTDFYRFTVEGLEEIFCDFEKVKSGMSAGPGTFLCHFVSQYVASFLPEGFGKLRLLVTFLVRLMLLPLKYLDCVRNPRKILPLANSVFFVGQKPEQSIE